MTKSNKFKETEIGKIPEDWSTHSLSQIIEIISGGTPKTSNPDYWNGSIPWISVADFGGDRRWIRKTEKHITQKGLEESSTNLLHKGQLIISARGTVGEIGQVVGDMAFNQSCYGLNGKETVFNDFLYYLLKYKLKDIQSNTHGSVFSTITKNAFDQLIVATPSIKEQRAIAKVLSDLDAKIELNRQMNETLEETAQALFRHWFVDFDFPNEQGKPYRSSGGKMIDSELGKIPEGWRVWKMRDHIRINSGLSYKGKFLSDNGVPLINLGTMTPNGFVSNKLKYYIGEFKERHTVKIGDIIIANTDITQNRDVLGSPAVVPQYLNSEKIIFTHHIFAVRNISNLSNQIIYYMLRLKRYHDRARGFATGTTILDLPEDAILDFTFALPEDNSLLLRISSFLVGIQNKIEKNIVENTRLEELRDSILPKLMSGKIRVS